MQLTYANEHLTAITVTLDDGENLGLLVGPVTATVPVDPLNTDYAAIRKQKLKVKPFTPGVTKEKRHG